MGYIFRFCSAGGVDAVESEFGMEERLRFVGEAMTEVCREFGISRKTGYKIFDRYREHGLEALSDRSRRPVRYANQLPQQVESLIVRLKSEKPHWGARKIRELLVRRLDGDIKVPAKSTISRGARPPRPGQAQRRAAPPRARHAAVAGHACQWAVVRRLQGRVQARQWPLLLSADRHRPCLALPAAL
jgi:transposase